MPRGKGTDTTTIIYPASCRDVTEDLGPDELIRRLKTLAHTFQSMGQDEGAYQEYIPLALHLVEDYFLQHPSRDVQLLIACCIADVLRIYAPEAPYKDPEQVKTIFMFLIKQLSGLKDPKDPAFKRYFYLLENLAYVKSFNMCFELEDCQEIFCALFSLMFKIVNDEHSGKVKSFMLDVLCPLVTESDTVSPELLDTILVNVVEPGKSQRKNAYLLAKELVVKCSDTLEPYIQAFFNQALILGKEEQKLSISKKVYDLIYELNHICPSVLLAVLPQLEFKLKSTDEHERMGSVSLLARMFSEKDSTLAIHHRQLWQAFLGRFNDISVSIRIKCVQYSMHFLMNHPELRKDITETLKLRQHDSEENVRYEVVMAIVSTAKKDFSIVSDSEDLLNFVKERTLDKKFKIRKEAMCGLAMIYKKHLSDADVPEATKKAVTWIKDKILHGYYMNNIDDRLLVERLLNTSLVPYQLPAEERMKKLLYLFGSIDENASKAFIELQKHQLAVRKSVGELIELHRRSVEERNKELGMRINHLAKNLPDAVKAQEFLRKFSHHLLRDDSLLLMMETVVKPDISCKDCEQAVTQILKKLGQPVMTNLYYNTIKMLLERISSVMVDRDAIKILVGFVEECLKGSDLVEEIGLNPLTAQERALKLLYVLSFVFPSHFLHEEILKHLLSFLERKEENVPPLVLSVLTFIGKYKPIETYPDVAKSLVPKCQEFAQTGTPKQAKQAVRCLFVNVTEKQDKVFNPILDKLKENLTAGSEYFRTAIVSLGHIAYNLPDQFPIQIKNIVSRRVVKELLMKNQGDRKMAPIDDWCDEEDLPEETRCKIEGMKMMARWLLGLKVDYISAQKTFRMLNAFVVHRGDLLEEGTLSKAEMAWLRYSAGCCMLKICEQKGVGDQFTPEQFYNLSLLMMDEQPQVREHFANKLHKGLGRGIPHKCLPLDFMGFYALAGREEDKRIKNLVKSYMCQDIQKRREYIKTLLMSMGSEKAQEQLPHIMPDYMLVFAVPILAHDPEYTQYDEVDHLKTLRQCLWFVLEPLMTKNENYCFGFYKALIERMKNHKDAVRSEDDAMNWKLWAVCDLAMGLIMSKTTNFEMKEFPSEPRIPPMYFKRHEDANFVNGQNYLPADMQQAVPKKPGITFPVVSVETKVITKRKGRGKLVENERSDEQASSIDVQPAEIQDTQVQIPGLEEGDSLGEPGSEGEEGQLKQAGLKSKEAVQKEKENSTVPDPCMESSSGRMPVNRATNRYQGPSAQHREILTEEGGIQSESIGTRKSIRQQKQMVTSSALSETESSPPMDSEDLIAYSPESIPGSTTASRKRGRAAKTTEAEDPLAKQTKSDESASSGSTTLSAQSPDPMKRSQSSGSSQNKITNYFSRKSVSIESKEQSKPEDTVVSSGSSGYVSSTSTFSSSAITSSEESQSLKKPEEKTITTTTRNSSRRAAAKPEQNEPASQPEEPVIAKKRGRLATRSAASESEPSQTSLKRGAQVSNGTEKETKKEVEEKTRPKKEEGPARKSARLAAGQDADDEGLSTRRGKVRK